MVILVVLALIGVWSWVVVFSKSVRERAPWTWTPHARLHPSDIVGKVAPSLVVAIATTLIVVFALVNEYWIVP